LKNKNNTISNKKQIFNDFLDHKRVDSDKLKINENTLAKIRCYFNKKKLNSDELKSKTLKAKNVGNRRYSLGFIGTDNLIEGRLLYDSNQNVKKSDNFQPSIKLTLYNNINFTNNNSNTPRQQNYSINTFNSNNSNNLLKKKGKGSVN